MGIKHQFIPEKLVIPLLYSLPVKNHTPFEQGSKFSKFQKLESFFNQVKSELESHYGPCDFVSEPIEFDFTTYYQSEMGELIQRRILSFENCINPQQLASIKIQTNELELQWADSEGNRKVNLDPGLLDLARLILATTKNRAHRIPLERGIYGEVTLLFKKGGFHGFDWSYVDYQSKPYQEILIKIRNIYKLQKRLMQQ